MNPDFEVRLKSIVKTLEQVILPSIPQENSLAREQTTVAINHLEMLRGQWSHAASYALICLADATALANAVLDFLDQRAIVIPQAIDISSLLEQDYPAADEATDLIWERRNRIVGAIDSLIDDSLHLGADVLKSLDLLILEFASREHVRDRSWFRATGLDPDGASLPSIAELFRNAGQH